MEELLISPYLLAALFFVVALLYSTSGLGGGTSYTALLGVFGTGPRAIPTISLTMNVLVSLMVSVNYIRAGHAPWRLIGAILAASVPMAYLGGWLPVAERLFFPILIGVLLLVAARIFLWPDPRLDVEWTGRWRLAASVVLGAAIGFLSGLVGIGGGIFLIPALRAASSLACQNRPNRCSCLSSGIPAPVSVTESGTMSAPRAVGEGGSPRCQQGRPGVAGYHG